MFRDMIRDFTTRTTESSGSPPVKLHSLLISQIFFSFISSQAHETRPQSVTLTTKGANA